MSMHQPMPEMEMPGTPRSKTRLIAEPGKQEFVIERTYDAPRELVFRAYTDPKLLSQWWAPRIYTVGIEKADIRPGGSWRIVNRDAEGKEYWFHGVVHDVTPPKRIVQTFEWEGMPGHASFETVRFEEVDGKTKVIDQSIFQSVEDRDGMLQSMGNAEAAMGDIMDRLGELLERLRNERMAA